ncbi:MAG: substrate-binding domain-containing protein [Klebsiella pneumoniae]|nr:substrate-binding domain-containing protein [Klebsiella pneumoniae]
MHKFTKALAAIGLAAVMSQSAMAENLKLGFLVKQPEEPWFQTEWKFADKAGKDLGFDVIKIAVPDGEKTLNAIDSLAASGAKGFVICTPDPKLGSAIVAKARGYDMKVITVDDQFVNAKGKPAQPTGFYGSLLPSPDIHGYKTSEMLYNWVTKGVEPPKFTAVTDVVLITRDNFKEELAKKGL